MSRPQQRQMLLPDAGDRQLGHSSEMLREEAVEAEACPVGVACRVPGDFCLLRLRRCIAVLSWRSGIYRVTADLPHAGQRNLGHFFLFIRQSPRSTLFPYTTRFSP